MNHRAGISRGDLIRGLAATRAADDTAAAAVARLCGFGRVEVAKPSMATPPVVPPGPGEMPTPKSSGGPRPAAVPASAGAIRLFVAERATTFKPEDAPDPGGPAWLKNATPYTETELEGTGVPLPPTPPLQSWARLWPWLRHALGEERTSRRLDTRALIRDVARLQPIHRLPRKRFLTWAERATVLLDRRAALSPFWDDMETLVHQLGRLRGTEGLRCGWMLEGTPAGEVRRFRDGQIFSGQPSPGEPVLVVSDLGNLSQDAGLRRFWLGQARAWQRQGNLCVALLPCPPERWETGLSRRWQSVCWDRGSRPPAHGGQSPRAADADPNRQVDAMLNLLAPAVRVEPGLLRALRLLIGAGQADVGTEFDVWHHAETARTTFAMALQPAASVRRQTEFARESPAIKAMVADLLERFHLGHSPTVHHRETLNLQAGGVALAAEKLEEAMHIQERLVATMFHQAKTTNQSSITQFGLYDWMRRELPRLLPAARSKREPVAAGWALVQFMSRDSAEAAPEGIQPYQVSWVPDLLLADPGVDTIWEVRWIGGELRLRPSESMREPSTGLKVGAPLAWLRVRRPRAALQAENADGQSSGWQFLLPPSGELRWPIGAARRVQLTSDGGSVELVAQSRPPWATRFGQDQAGLFAEFEVERVRFRLRWIPPGNFLMGSPESEAGRNPDEGPQHRVTISNGFWLADTPCTQEQWQAIMGENPSYFKEPDEPKRPVESLDWEQCRTFCARVRERIPDLDFRLPTEAEWEYACRAGTTSAFNDGSDCTVPDGKDSALERLGWHGEGEQGKTYHVGGKLANRWGLYDMHGNVWEWCADQADLKDGLAVTDTYVDGIADPVGKSGARRVVRGGSYWYQAEFCRSAYRDASVPGYRLRDLGFRLAASPASGASRSASPQ